ncbi:MAG TPA: methylated-DNA--[protein]-cysteine S-methyltransferase [Pirellulales bacterium]|jgi:methylated-DNA-[protein]-cysteine S-methyltransferase|nr:methylated-DNA--[protein]-cysteine S-methyltransferase [Pirellulales bacterium]
MVREVHSMPQHTSFCVFSTALGWMAAAGRDGIVSRLSIGHRSLLAAQRAIDVDLPLDAREANWHPELKRRLCAFAAGARDDFRDIQIDISYGTALQRRMLADCRRIDFGQTLSYGELAERAGAPGAARAAGSCLAKNRVAIIIPCHRVIASGGRIGGFTAGGGVAFKRRLLALEGASFAPRAKEHG